ncbi:MAG: putative DNA binding domain-containing protein [Planctomycetes bacterium]|nr:putative DNA binding domain-containing protein [Planctomycetota bacterium]
MFDTPEALLDKIRLGEDSLLECKEMEFAGAKVKAPARGDLADELAAAANAHGCVVVLGVHDKTRAILGIPLEQLDAAESFVRELCHDSIRPPLLARIERLELTPADGIRRAVLRVDVDRSLFVHESPGGYLHRVGSSKRKMSPEHLARLMQHRSQARLIHFDEQVVPGTTWSDLDPDLVARFRSDLTTDDAPTFARKLAMVGEDSNGVLRATVAGLLLGARQPERWLPHAYIQAVAYRGTAIDAGRDYQLDAKDLTGPLDHQVAEACRFVARNMRVGASKLVGRVDQPQFDMTAVFEALVNAVAHRDYSIHGAKIRLRLFDDRLELYSPGALANTMTVESILVRQVTRNEAITSLLAKLEIPTGLPGLSGARARMMDRRGEGAPLIMRRSEALSGKRPIYSTLDGSELLLTIFAAGRGLD